LALNFIRPQGGVVDELLNGHSLHKRTAASVGGYRKFVRGRELSKQLKKISLERRPATFPATGAAPQSLTDSKCGCAPDGRWPQLHAPRVAKKHSCTAERKTAGPIGLYKETKMPRSNRAPIFAETGEQVPTRPHDSGSQANETVDGLNATTEALRHAAEDTPSGASPDDVEKVPVFDRAGQAPKI
jgi:hypothetical protein